MMFRNRMKLGESGGTAAEFAIVAPVMLLFVVGIIEFSIVEFLGSMIESALLEASRYGVTGFSNQGVTRDQAIRNIMNKWTMGILDPAKVMITSKAYPSFQDIGKPEPFVDQNGNGMWDSGEPFTDINGNGKWDPDMGEAGLGGSGDVVLYTVTYDWGLLTGMLKPFFNNIHYTSSIAIRNEPF